MTTKPKVCKCDPKTWDEPNDEICDEFVPFKNGKSVMCANCDHDEACHEQPEEVCKQQAK